MDNQNQNLPAVQPPPSAASAALAEWQADKPPFITNFPLDDPDKLLRVMTAKGLSDRQSRDCKGQTLEIVGAVIDYGPVGEDADGELAEGVRGHIMCADGTTVFTTARGVLEGLSACFHVYGKGEWSPAVKFEIVPVKAKRGEALIGIPRGRVAKKGGAK